MQEITQDMINVIRDLFIVRDDCYPQQVEGANEYIVIKQKLPDDIIKKHLQGFITIGSFQIDPQTNKVKWICFDFDGELDKELEKAKVLFYRLKEKGYNPLMEFSGRRGYHIWLFVELIDASVAKMFAYEIAKNMEISDVYPKQDKIESTGFGGQVKIPLGIHRASNKRSYFLNEDFNIVTYQASLELLLLLEKSRDIILVKTIKDFTGD